MFFSFVGGTQSPKKEMRGVWIIAVKNHDRVLRYNDKEDREIAE